MSDDEESYCRLCAEPTPKDNLISTDEEVGLHSKIGTKMKWINIDVSVNILPNTICFACFDALERTWTFLHNTRLAQSKLKEIFSIKKNCNEKDSEIGKPVNTDWDNFQGTKVKTESTLHFTKTTSNVSNKKSDSWSQCGSPKNEVKQENLHLAGNTILIDIDSIVKNERISDNDVHFSNQYSSDSDQPLQVLQKKKSKKKKFKSIDLEKPAPVTWEEYTCRCAICDALFKNISSLRLHTVQIHSCCCSFKCSECGKVISNYRLFVKHVRIHKKGLRRCCEFCNKTFPMSSSLKLHINVHHNEAYLLMCQSCGACFDSTELLQDHIILFNRKFRNRTLNTDLKCEYCNKEFKSKCNLQQHKLVHTARTREFSCHVCGKMFYTKGSLGTHLSTHEDNKPYKCEYCPMAFKARGNLQSHRTLHTGIKPFVCEQCGKSFRVKKHLKSHSIMHTDLMPYVCEFCNKSFRFKTRLNLHLRQHTGVKPYKCGICQRDFTNGSNYKKHMKRRHNIDTSKNKFNLSKDSLDSKDEICSQNNTNV